MSRVSTHLSIQHSEKHWTHCVTSTLAKTQSHMTLRQWLTRLHVLALRHQTKSESVSTSVRKGRIILHYNRRGMSVLPYNGYSPIKIRSSLHRMGTMMQHGSGLRIAYVATDIGSTRCWHTILYTRRCHMTSALSRLSIRTTHTIRMKGN